MVAWYVSKPSAPVREKLSAGQEIFLRKVARKTWRYFETFVTQEDHWLPPDNVQYNSGQVVSPRTSPTNIGMGLLSDLAAYDFGYCSVERLLNRTERTFGTIAKLEKYQGHFFNWYDTRTLQPLSPRYVSTVDSGNLMGQLLVLASGLRRVVDDSILPPQLFMGLRDALLLFLDAGSSPAGSSPAGERLASSTLGITNDIRRAVEQQIDSLEQCPCTLTHAIEVLPRCLQLAESLKGLCLTDSDMEWWVSAFEGSCREQLESMHELVGWLFLPGGEAAYRYSQTPNGKLYMHRYMVW